MKTDESHEDVTREQELLSAFVDEETSEFEVHRLCKSLLDNERELARLGRYYMVRDALRGNLPTKLDVKFAAGVMAAVEREPLNVVPVTPGNRRARLLKPAVGFGLAASIAVCAVLALQSFTGSSSSNSPVANVAQLSPTSPSPNPRLLRRASANSSAAAGAPEASLANNPDVAARLNSYLANHSEYAPSRGMMSYARVVVGYEGDQ
ncbi:MAG: sigma-E factor negative regulatory protein [Gammaproteobacteria bacterium]